MKAPLALLLALPLSLSAADLVFTGGLERLGHGSITIRMADGRVVDAVLSAGIAVPFHVADQVEIICTPSRTVYDAQAQLHNHLRLKSLQLMRTATPQERAEMEGWLSWQPGENLLMPPRPSAPSEVLTSLERVRAVNLDYVARMADFVADETVRDYVSDAIGKPWRLDRTIEDEVAVKDLHLTHRSVRRNGKPWKGKDFGSAGFGLEIKSLFDPQCPNRIEFGWTERARGKARSVYLFSSPDTSVWRGPFGIFLARSKDVPRCSINMGLHFGWGPGNWWNPARTGRISVDAATGNVVGYEEGVFLRENSGADWFTFAESWGDVTIGGSSYLVPLTGESVIRGSDGRMDRTTTEYKNQRHFETSTTTTFGSPTPPTNSSDEPGR